MNLGGIISGAIGGGAHAVGEIASEGIKNDFQQQLLVAQQEAERVKQEAILRAHDQISADRRAASAKELRSEIDRRTAAGEDGKGLVGRAALSTGQMDPKDYVRSEDINAGIDARLSKVEADNETRKAIADDKNASGERNVDVREKARTERNDATNSSAERRAQTRAGAAAAGGKAIPRDLQGLQQERISADADAKLLANTIAAERRNQQNMSRAQIAESNSRISGLESELGLVRDRKNSINDRLADFSTRQAAGATTANPGKVEAPSAPAKSSPAAGSIPAPASKAEYDKLKPGTRYTAPDGTTKIKG